MKLLQYFGVIFLVLIISAQSYGEGYKVTLVASTGAEEVSIGFLDDSGQVSGTNAGYHPFVWSETTGYNSLLNDTLMVLGMSDSGYIVGLANELNSLTTLVLRSQVNEHRFQL